MSSCNKFCFSEHGPVLQSIRSHFSSGQYVCAVAHILAALQKQKATARGVQQMPALTRVQEAPDPSRRLQALLRSPSFTGSTRPVSAQAHVLIVGMYGADIC